MRTNENRFIYYNLMPISHAQLIIADYGEYLYALLQ